MDLLIAGFVLLLLFVATYSQRRTWITLGSTALSIVLIAGCVFLSTAQTSSQIHGGLAQLAKSFPAGWDRPALKLTAAMEQASTSLAQARHRAAARAPQPFLTASIASWFTWAPESGAKVEPELEYAPAPLAARVEPEPAPAAVAEATPDTPIQWFLDEPQPTASAGFLLSGANLSDQPLEAVQAVLKPDSGAGELELALNVEGDSGGDGAVIPPGARFSLAAEGLSKDKVQRLGGTILSFAYVQAGRRKTSIMYLPQATLAASDEVTRLTE
ncbi:MAG TPA: hypothetical protein VMW57_07515 [Methyloceanibacter sp.]|nr:hypothetical protein [Methyloceanibacter sp.]